MLQSKMEYYLALQDRTVCFLDVSCAFLFPIIQKAAPCPVQNLPKPKLKDRGNSPRLSASSPSCSTRHGPIIYGSQCASSSVHNVHYAFKRLPFSARLQPCRGFLFPPHLAFCFHSLRLSVFLCVCAETLLEFAGQRGAPKEVDFSQH